MTETNTGISASTGFKIDRTLWMQTQLILGQADANRMYRDGTGRVSSVRHGWLYSQIPLPIANAGVYERVNDQVSNLVRLFATLIPDLQQQFPKALFAQLNERTAPIVVHVFAELGLIDSLNGFDRDVSDRTAHELWATVGETLVIEPSLFTEDDFNCLFQMMRPAREKIREAMKPPLNNKLGDARNLDSRLDDVTKAIQRIRYLRLSNDLQTIRNPTIDSDRRVLVSRLQTLGFSETLLESLRHLERKTEAAATQIDFKGCADLLRTLFEEFVEESSQKVAAVTGKTIPAKGETPRFTHFASFKKYLGECGVITTDEEAVLQALYNVESNEGAHKLLNVPEQVHIWTTTVVEWCLMIAGRVQQLITQDSKTL